MIGTIKVVNTKTFKEDTNGKIINIMAPEILGNPFRMNTEDEREISVRKFYHYLREKYKEKGEIYDELMKIVDMVKNGEDIYLVCCCAPKLCHGEVIARAVMGIINNEQKTK